MKSRVGAFAIALCVFTRVARGEESHSGHYARVVNGELTAGVGTPVGFVGAGLAVAPVPWLSIAAGGGVGQFGPEGMLALRPRLIARKMAFGIGVGPSIGRYGGTTKPQLEDGPTYTKRWDYVLWMNVEPYIERRGDAGLGFRIFIGGAYAVMKGPVSCTDTRDDRDQQACEAWQPPKPLPYFGGSLVFYAQVHASSIRSDENSGTSEQRRRKSFGSDV